MRPSLLIGAVLLLAACGTQTTGGEGSASGTAPPASVQATTGETASTGCPPGVDWPAQEAPDSPGEPLPEGVSPIAVIWCQADIREVAGDGRWVVLEQRRADSGFTALVAAMRASSEPTPSDLACTADLVIAPWLAFVRADGSQVHAAVPLTACHKPAPAVLAALDAVEFVVVATTKVRQLATEPDVAADKAAEALGCTGTFKDMIAITAADPSSSGSPAGPLLPYRPTSVTICRYATAASDPDVLHFVSGERLSPADSAAAVAAAEASTEALPCDRPHSAVAGLFADSGWILAELDGCHRVVGASGALRQASPALLAALG